MQRLEALAPKGASSGARHADSGSDPFGVYGTSRTDLTRGFKSPRRLQKA
jgi:hypothetical protein